MSRVVAVVKAHATREWPWTGAFVLAAWFAITDGTAALFGALTAAAQAHDSLPLAVLAAMSLAVPIGLVSVAWRPWIRLVCRALARPLPLSASADPSLARLVAGIERRLETLTARLKALPEARRGFLADLAAAAQGTAQDVGRAVERLATLPDPDLPGQSLTEAPTAPTGTPRPTDSRDAEVQRLLALAAALDDALAAVDLAAAGVAPDPVALATRSSALLALHEEFAPRAIDVAPEGAAGALAGPPRAVR